LARRNSAHALLPSGIVAIDRTQLTVFFIAKRIAFGDRIASRPRLLGFDNSLSGANRSFESSELSFPHPVPICNMLMEFAVARRNRSGERGGKHRPHDVK
jgi:hypothetical protein